ncbi:MAG: metallophosphoesterase family protein [Anaerolineae bacterium]
MKLGLIADVHADVEALRQALDRLDALGVGAVLCAGDLVDYGFWPDETISLMRARGIPCVLGNHDRRLFTRPPEKRKPRHSDPDAITPENLKYLRALPARLDRRYGGLRVAVHHGALTSDTALVHPKFSTPRALAEMIAASRANVLVLGHTHVPVHFVAPAGRLINPGSLFVHHDTGRYTSRTVGVLDTETLDYRLFDVVSGVEHPQTTWPWWKDQTPVDEA